MYFSEYFKVKKQLIEDYGAIDINLICDLPLFIDPMLIFNSQKQEYVDLHPRLSHIFEQVAIYEQANQCTDSLYAIFYFNEAERVKVKNMLIDTKTDKLLDKSIFIIDCSYDNKQSASQADAHPLE